jgi:hypothetical protein
MLTQYARGVPDKIEEIARQRRVSGNHVIVDLLQDAIAACENRRPHFWIWLTDFRSPLILQRQSDCAKSLRTRHSAADAEDQLESAS